MESIVLKKNNENDYKEPFNITYFEKLEKKMKISKYEIKCLVVEVVYILFHHANVTYHNTSASLGKVVFS